MQRPVYYNRMLIDFGEKGEKKKARVLIDWLVWFNVM